MGTLHSTQAYLLILVSAGLAAAQTPKKPLSHDVYDGWMRITGESIAGDGRHVMYTLEPGEGDARLIIPGVAGGRPDTIARGTGGKFTEASDFAVCTIRPQFSAIKKARDEKKKGDDA